MEHRAQLRNNSGFFIILVWACFLLSCDPQQEQAVVPGVTVPSTDAALSINNGIIYYDKQLFSGVVFSLYPNGDTATIARYVNGKEDGWQRKWYPNMRLAEERFYSAGKKEGIHRSWWENGKPRFEYYFKNDEHEGQLKEWYADGTPARLFHYSKGFEDGRQQMWWQDGRIRANYIVKDGERFGLIGQKLCKNNMQ